MPRKTKPPAPAVEPPSYPPGAFSAWGVGWAQDPATGEWKPPNAQAQSPANVDASALLKAGMGNSWRAGFEEGARTAVGQIFQLLEKKLGKTEADRVTKALAPRGLAEALVPAPDTDATAHFLIVEFLNAHSQTGETPAQKSARARRLQRILRDEAQAIELAALIREGHTTESARTKMKLGVVRAQRIRAVAVRLGFIEGRKKKA